MTSRRLPSVLPRLLALLVLLGGCGGSGFPWPLKRPRAGSAGAQRELAAHGQVTPLGPRYDRGTARAMLRRVARPTRAALDYAVYAANAMLRQEDVDPVQPAAGEVAIDRRRLFGGLVDAGTIVAAIADTPLTPSERRAPLACSPLVDYLSQWNAARARGLEDARAAVRGETWGLHKRPGTTFQEIAALYLHRPRPGAAVELWAMIEFQPWARLFQDLPDEDGDGYPQIYGRLRPGLIDAEVLARIERDYAGRALGPAEVARWANELASYWYPSHNTDIADLGGSQRWPTAGTEPEVVAALGGFTVQQPTIVIRGKPHGQAIYNVLVVPGMPTVTGKQQAPTTAASDGAGRDAALLAELKQVAVSAETQALSRALSAEVARNGAGAGHAGWVERLRPLRASIRGQLRRRPRKLQALIGEQGFLFYRKSLDYVVGGDIQQQSPGKNPFAAIVSFKDQLARLGVDFLLVPVPAKAEVFADLLPGAAARAVAIREPINPHGRKFVGELAAAGVEVVDLLPAFLAARQARAPGDEWLYQSQDTHWTDRGLRLAARLIGERVQRYRWYATLSQRAVRYGQQKVTFNRLGDLPSRLAPREQPRYAPQPLVAHQVRRPDGELYEDEPGSPIVVVGDSFTGVYQRVDCEHAGVTAHIAREISYPVDLVMSWGGGPNVRQQLLERGEAELRDKTRLVIWILAARDFHGYWEDWQVLGQGDDKRGAP